MTIIVSPVVVLEPNITLGVVDDPNEAIAGDCTKEIGVGVGVAVALGGGAAVGVGVGPWAVTDWTLKIIDTEKAPITKPRTPASLNLTGFLLGKLSRVVHTT